jgi:hypothetical protein
VADLVPGVNPANDDERQRTTVNTNERQNPDRARSSLESRTVAVTERLLQDRDRSTAGVESGERRRASLNTPRLRPLFRWCSLPFVEQLRDHHYGHDQLATSPERSTNKKRAAPGHARLGFDELMVLTEKPQNDQKMFSGLAS